jgi:hypothetical protein
MVGGRGWEERSVDRMDGVNNLMIGMERVTVASDFSQIIFSG